MPKRKITQEERWEVGKKMTFLSGLLPYLLETLDDLEKYPTIFKHELKRDTKQLQKSVEKRLDHIYKDITEIESTQGFNLINKIAEALDGVYKSYEKQIENEREET